MDPRERLRRYLEQRREMGERELVLDGMSVDDVMRILGAEADRQRVAVPPLGRPAADRRATEPRTGVEAPSETDTARSTGDPADWRAVLRATGSAPAQPAERAHPTLPARPEPPASSPEPPASSPQPPASPPQPPASPPVRRDTETPPDHPASAQPDRIPERPADRVPDATSSGIVVGTAARELFGGPFGDIPTLDELATAVANCTRCPLYRTARNPVPGEGSATAQLVCVGEAPGQTEDETGRPFVGQAGQLLTKILAAINLRREDVFICNVLKHRPPANRNPAPQEVQACSPYLVRQLEIIRPKVIVAFGTFAAQTLLDTKLAIGKLRGTVHRYYGIPLVVTYHPAALLRNPAWKRPTWEDVQLARRVLDRANGT